MKVRTKIRSIVKILCQMQALAMNTRDRILQVSLLLFNEEGESEQTALDISNALEISPGNLYYHFKGKDSIIRSLFDEFEIEMQLILRGSADRVSSLEDKWLYLYIILEEIYDFRFFYRDLANLLNKYPDLAVRFRAIQTETHTTVMRTLSNRLQRTGSKYRRARQAALSDQVMLTLNFWLAADAIQMKAMAGPDLIHQTVFRLMTLIDPLDDERKQKEVMALMDAHLRALR